MSTEEVKVASPAVYSGEASPAVKELIEAGVFYGMKKSKTHPAMKPYVVLNRGGVDIINLDKTLQAMEKAAGFIEEIARNDGLVLLVGTQPAAQQKILTAGKKLRLPYVVNRWPGGAITNFKVLSKRIEYFTKLREDLSSGVMSKYTKKERLMLERELERLRELFEGLETMKKQPDLLIVIDPVLHHTAVREARRAKIPIVALANLDVDPDSVDYLVPGNDNGLKSIDWFLGKVENALSSGLSKKLEKKDKEEKERPKA